MACSIPHTYDEIKAMVEKQIEEDKSHEEALKQIVEEEAMDEKEREEKIRQKQADDEEYYLEFRVVRYDSEYDTRVEPSLLTPNPVRIILGLAGIVQLSSSTRVEPSPLTLNLVRIIPSSAGFVQQAKLLKESDILLG
nr:hypothetical protein [Tanacetum cinerariifolium]